MLYAKDADRLLGPFEYDILANRKSGGGEGEGYSFVVREKDKKFRIFLRGIKKIDDPDFKGIAWGHLENFLLGSLLGSEIYVLKEACVKLDGGDLKGIVYVPRVSFVNTDVTTGETRRFVSEYGMLQVFYLVDGFVALDKKDSEYLQYEAFLGAEKLGREEKRGYWDPSKQWLKNLEKWRATHKEEEIMPPGEDVLSEQVRKKLDGFQESGPGYRRVTVTLADGKQVPNVIVGVAHNNSEYVMSLPSGKPCPFRKKDVVGVEWEGLGRGKE